MESQSPHDGDNAEQEDPNAPLNADGLGLRSYALESRYGYTQSRNSGEASRRAHEWGLRGEYRLETLNYGEFSAQIDGRTRHGDNYLSSGSLGYATENSSGRITLRNIGFPITPHTFADTTAGDMYSEPTEAFRRSYRLSLGTSTVRGIGTRIYDRDFDLAAGTGQRGTLSGGPFPGFEQSTGTLSWLGYSHRLPNGLFAGAQATKANDIPVYSHTNTLPSAAGREDVKSWAATAGYGTNLLVEGDTRARLTWVQSTTTATVAERPNQAHGAFLEAGWKHSGYRHELGVYQASPNLRFGDNLLASDNRGAYWRVDHASSRLFWGMGLDYEQYNPQHAPTRYASRQVGVHANGQYRLDRHSALGASASLSRLRYDNSDGPMDATRNGLDTLFFSGFYQTRINDWGTSRVRLTARRNQTLVVNDVASTGQELEWEQDWITGKYETMRPEFTTTLGWARDQSTGDTQTYPTAGVTLRHWFDATWSVGGHLRYTSRSGNLSTSRGLSGSLNTEALLTNGWRLGAALQLNQARVETVPMAGIPTAQVSRSNDKTAYIYLRWDGSTGTPLQAMGLRSPTAVGGGGIRGTVYFDENRDGEQQANESGVPHVEVLLDGRYRTTTDASGQFEFPVVATGGHQLSIQLETVPLPWGAAQDQGLNIEVPLRGQAYARIPVVQVGSE